MHIFFSITSIISDSFQHTSRCERVYFPVFFLDHGEDMRNYYSASDLTSCVGTCQTLAHDRPIRILLSQVADVSPRAARSSYLF